MSGVYRMYSSYRQVGRWCWYGRVYANPGWVAMRLDGIPSRLLWYGYALSERGICKRIARELMSRRGGETWRRTGERPFAQRARANP